MAKNKIQLWKKKKVLLLGIVQFPFCNESSFTQGGDDSDNFEMWLFYLRFRYVTKRVLKEGCLFLNLGRE